MKNKLLFCKPSDNRLFTEKSQLGFQHITTKKGEKHIFKTTTSYIIVFILKGKAQASCNDSGNVLFNENELLLWPLHSKCTWESLTDTESIILMEENKLPECGKELIKESADIWLNAIPDFKSLPIRPCLMEYLYTIKSFLKDGISCTYMHKTKLRELELIFRSYYQTYELVDFFLPIVSSSQEFKSFVKGKYLKMKKEKEFDDFRKADDSGTYNLKFKPYLRYAPHEWLVKQKSRHIYKALSGSGKEIMEIAKEFHFSDIYSLKRYCEIMFDKARLSDIYKVRSNWII